ncbi:hypothetical protein HYDPIDRAFT_169390 [Hydnomerulius pinastri MD-312]|uniref:RanBP2-type domain-containing protein n=1 Tax=Hydnomerulius pinastri MD-312 TaxID=994086 RepID=A0A0C9WCY3_9AGAM|nr:hypothetical protein HYDPIDRAFT_169390 [Hydnomerulius pinastri MD-312]
MSAVRRSDRRATRNTISSPYSRPSKSSRAPPKKKSLWSFSGLISLLNPFGGLSGSDRDDSDLSGNSDYEVEETSPPRAPPQFNFPPPPPLPPQQQLPPTPVNVPVVNGQAGSSQATQTPPRNQLPFPLNTATSQIASSPSSSLARNLEPVTRFLVEKAGQPLNDFEAAGIVDYIQKNVQGSASVPDKPEPFRFSTSPSRGTSPNLGFGSSNNNDASSGQPPRKTLSRNPNGVYRWQGAGSSRPRNRYQSPGFGPRSQPARIKLSPPKTPLTTDTKRRRVGDEADSATPQRAVVLSTSTVSFPSSSTESPVQASQPNGKAPAVAPLAPAPPVTPKANGAQQPSRLRTTGLVMKPTAPSVPSPLRQAWKQTDSPPQPSPPSRPTRAADFMTELIKEVTPTKKPDVSNPYQTASPIKPPPAARKPVPKRPRPSTKAAEKPKEKEPEVSAQAIIEATIPKGSKRSRPPLEMEKATRAEEVLEDESSAPATNGFSQPPRFRGAARTAVDFEEVDDDDESPTKKRKTAAQIAPKPQASVQVEEVNDIDASKATPSSFTRPTEVIEPGDDATKVNGKSSAPTLSPPSAPPKSLFGTTKTSAPKEPSKLRYSYQADKVEVKSTDGAPPPMPPAPPIASLFAPPPVPLPPAPAPTKAKVGLSPKDEVMAMDVDELPKYTFSSSKETTYPAGPSSLAARQTVLALPTSSLPTFDIKPAPVTAPVAAPVRAMNGFNWTAAGLKVPTSSGGGQKWKCTTCDLENPASAVEKCTICDAPRPASTLSSSPSPAPTPTPPTTSTPAAPPLAPVKAFDWSAAGIAPPPKSTSGTWTCTVCGLSNPASATACTVCEEPR